MLDGPNIYFDAQSAIRLSSGALLQACGGEVHIDGGPNVFINSGGGGAPGVASLGGAAGGRPRRRGERGRGRGQARPPARHPGPLARRGPDALAIPAHVEQQIEQERVKILTGIEIARPR